jgi:stringent starvation protein B
VRHSYTTVYVTSSPLPAKKDVARALLLRGSVFVHLDPRRPGVLVPARLRHQAQVVLQVGLDMPVPIPDLRVDEEGIFGTLSFKGVPFSCFVPWAAVFALVGEDAKGMVWSREMPDEIATALVRESKRGSGDRADLVRLDDYRHRDARTSEARTSMLAPKRRSDRPPAWDRPAYLRVVK